MFYARQDRPNLPTLVPPVKSSFEASLWDEVRQAVREDPDLRFWGHFNWYFRAKPLPYWATRPFLSLALFFSCVFILPLGFVVTVSLTPAFGGSQFHNVSNATVPYDPFIIIAGAWIFICVMIFGLLPIHLSPHKFHQPVFFGTYRSPIQGCFQWNSKWLWQELIMSQLELVIAFTIFAYCLGFSWLGYFTLLVLVPLNRLFTLSLAMLIGLRLPTIGIPIIACIAFPILCLSIVPGLFPVETDGLETGQVFGLSNVTNLCLPTGYAIDLMRLWLPQPNWWTGLYLVPITLVISTLPNSLKRLRERFNYSDEEWNEKKPEVPQSEAPVEITQRPILQKGPLERALWHWFTPRQKKLAPFLFPNDLELTFSWVLIYLGFIAILTDCFLNKEDLKIYLSSDHSSSVVGRVDFLICLPIAACVVAGIMPKLLREGPHDRVIHFSGTSIHLFSPYPITYLETVSILMKYTIIQLPAFAVIIVTSGVVIADYCGFSPLMGGVKGLELCLCFCGIRLCLLSLGMGIGALNLLMSLNCYYWFRWIINLIVSSSIRIVACFLCSFSLTAPFIIWDDELLSIALSFFATGLSFLFLLVNSAVYPSRMYDLLYRGKTPFFNSKARLPWEGKTL